MARLMAGSKIGPSFASIQSAGAASLTARVLLRALVYTVPKWRGKQDHRHDGCVDETCHRSGQHAHASVEHVRTGDPSGERHPAPNEGIQQHAAQHQQDQESRRSGPRVFDEAPAIKVTRCRQAAPQSDENSRHEGGKLCRAAQEPSAPAWPDAERHNEQEQQIDAVQGARHIYDKVHALLLESRLQPAGRNSACRSAHGFKRAFSLRLSLVVRLFDATLGPSRRFEAVIPNAMNSRTCDLTGAADAQAECL